MSSTPALFTVRRHAPVLVPPAKPTPHEFKPLSDLDDTIFVRCRVPIIHMFHRSASMEGRDPTEVIKDALSKALVFYYPLAGRPRELMPSRKLIVECTGEGVLFVEADADAELEIFGDELKPPLPCQEKLIHPVEGSTGTVNCPMLFIQVTRFRCGGFIFAFYINHIIMDGIGMVQFMKAMAEIARGADAPSVMPVWERELLTAMNPPLMISDVMETLAGSEGSSYYVDIVHRCFFFGPKEMAALWRQVPSHLHRSTKFEVLTAALWRCRARAVGADLKDPSLLLFPVNIRKRINPPLPAGYYGNAVAPSLGMCGTAELCSKPLSFAIEIVKNNKSSVDDEHVRRTLCVMAQREMITENLTGRTWFGLTDTAGVGFDEVDFGWGKATFAAIVGFENLAPNYYMRGRNKEGEDGILVYLSLPAATMERIAAEIESMIKP